MLNEVNYKEFLEQLNATAPVLKEYFLQKNIIGAPI